MEVTSTKHFFFVLGLGLTALLKSSRRQRNLLVFALALLAFPFLPASNLFFPVGFVVAERILYLPSMGSCLLVAYGLEKLMTQTTSAAISPVSSQKLLKFCLALLIATHAVKTVVRNQDWKDELTIFKSG